MFCECQHFCSNVLYNVGVEKKGGKIVKENNHENVLKKLALDAKNRLKNCKYNNKQENLNIKRSIAFQNHLRMIKESETKSPEITIKIINDYAEQQDFQNKVIKLLQTNADCLSPLKELSDNKMLGLMSEAEKQKYIFDLSEKYNQVKDDYYKSMRAYM